MGHTVKLTADEEQLTCDNAAQSATRKRWAIVRLSLFLLPLMAMVTFMTYYEPSPQPPSWNLGFTLSMHSASWLRVAEPAFLQLADPALTSVEVLKSLSTYSSCVVVTTGGGSPARRAADVPYLSVDPPELLPSGVVAALNRGAAAAEAVLGRRFFPVTLHAVDDFAAAHGTTSSDRRPYAVFDLSSGVLSIDRLLVESWRSPEVEYLMGSVGEGIFSSIKKVGDLATTATGDAPSAVLTLLLASSAIAITAAFAAAPPLWFCLACPALLGLLAPLAINFGLGDLAALACSRLSLSDDECFDLMLGALGLGFVLSLASAVPIFMVCRMYECSHRNVSTSVTTALGLPRALAPFWRRRV